jgi:ribbon-helix-helix CopG family protein
MPFNVRLNAKTERLLNALAKRRGQTRSDIAREAIEQFGEAQISSTQRLTAYDQWADVIGVARTAGRDSSKTTGDLFSDIMKRKARARRAR